MRLNFIKFNPSVSGYIARNHYVVVRATLLLGAVELPERFSALVLKLF